ncbi:protein sneaky [Drosophila innubila]|uniref:protein sneaky n=1 Tax=Drosophila innubila TaxID=198719 RepID=UPI00148BEDF2|nr:protein sneaky [Drosophila innubila]
MRYLCSFLLGVLLAYLMWLLVSNNCNLSFLYGNAMVEVPVLTIFLLLNGLAFVLSRNVRAVTLLIFVSLADKAGRRYLRAVAFGFVISGPIDNLVTNAGEVARVFACTTMLTYNLTKTRLDLMAKPFTNTLQHMKGDIDEIQDTFKELQTILNDLKYGLEHADSEDQSFDLSKYRRAGNTTVQPYGNITFNPKLPNAAEVQEQFVRKIGNRCKHQLNSGHQVCQEVFSQGFRKCATNFPNWLANAICWPYRIDIICKVNMFGNPDKVCDASKVVQSDFGKTYVDLLKTEQELYGNSSNIEISYKLQNTSTAAQLRSAQRTSEEFMKDFERRKLMFKTLMTIIDKLMCLFIFYVIWSAMKYHWKYRSEVDFDNFYITEYFKHLDERRKKSNQRSVLPLRKLDKSRTVDEDELCSLTVAESTIEIYHIVQLSLEIITTGIFIILDHMVVNLLRIINHRSLISYHQEGEHEVRFRINGTGLMARLLRTTMKNFNIHERVSTSLSNEECLPVAHSLPRSFYLKLILIYLIIILLIYQTTSISRLRRVICSYFYYKREKTRICFLYGSMLRNHASYLNDIRQTAEDNMAIRHMQGNLNIFLILRLSYPKHFGWLQKFKCGKRSCLVCSALEDSKFIICPNCAYPFCHDCCGEMNWICIFCEQHMPHHMHHVAAEESEVTSVDLYANGKKKS